MDVEVSLPPPPSTPKNQAPVSQVILSQQKSRVTPAQDKPRPPPKTYTPAKYGNGVTDNKLTNLLDFLEQQENEPIPSSVLTLEPPSSARHGKFLSLRSGVPINIVTDAIVDGVKSRIVALEVEIEDKAKTIEIMKSTIKQMKAKEQQSIAETYDFPFTLHGILHLTSCIKGSRDTKTR